MNYCNKREKYTVRRMDTFFFIIIDRFKLNGGGEKSRHYISPFREEAVLLK